MALKGHNAP